MSPVRNFLQYNYEKKCLNLQGEEIIKLDQTKPKKSVAWETRKSNTVENQIESFLHHWLPSNVPQVKKKCHPSLKAFPMKKEG